MLNILSVDLEEWYHPEYVKAQAVSSKEDRLLRTLDETLRLLESKNTEATFFVVGELAEKNPEIIETIRKKGNRIGFHGFNHEPLSKLSAEKLRLEISKFNDLTRQECLGFRAPSFSLSNKTKWAVKVLEEAGYKYDSSVFPSKTPLYGQYDAPMRPYRLSYENVGAEDANAKLWEFSLLVYSLAGIRIPAAGGFYLRLLPLNFISRAIKKANKGGFPAVVFFHNWELDPETPRMNLGFYKSFVTYHNLRGTRRKLESLLSKFKFSSIEDYMEQNKL